MGFFDWIASMFSSVPKTNIIVSANFTLLNPEYLSNWNDCMIGPQWKAQAETASATILSNQAKYVEVQNATGVPWYLVGCLHYRESDFDFNTCLHNGDPLPGPTVNVPAGRGPFSSWSLAAIDALQYDHLDQNKDWSIARCLYASEEYNGFGYRMKHGTQSPYLWSGTNIYTYGKYDSDGSFNPNALDDQLGVAAILKQMTNDGSITW